MQKRAAQQEMGADDQGSPLQACVGLSGFYAAWTGFAVAVDRLLGYSTKKVNGAGFLSCAIYLALYAP